MEGELDLLLSVAGGLGRWQYVDDLKRVYVKDDDCLGERMTSAAFPTACHGELQRECRSAAVGTTVISALQVRRGCLAHPAQSLIMPHAFSFGHFLQPVPAHPCLLLRHNSVPQGPGALSEAGRPREPGSLFQAGAAADCGERCVPAAGGIPD